MRKWVVFLFIGVTSCTMVNRKKSDQRRNDQNNVNISVDFSSGGLNLVARSDNSGPEVNEFTIKSQCSSHLIKILNPDNLKDTKFYVGDRCSFKLLNFTTVNGDRWKRSIADNDWDIQGEDKYFLKEIEDGGSSNQGILVSVSEMVDMIKDVSVDSTGVTVNPNNIEFKVSEIYSGKKHSSEIAKQMANIKFLETNAPKFIVVTSATFPEDIDDCNQVQGKLTGETCQINTKSFRTHYQVVLGCTEGDTPDKCGDWELDEIEFVTTQASIHDNSIRGEELNHAFRRAEKNCEKESKINIQVNNICPLSHLKVVNNCSFNHDGSKEENKICVYFNLIDLLPVEHNDSYDIYLRVKKDEEDSPYAYTRLRIARRL